MLGMFALFVFTFCYWNFEGVWYGKPLDVDKVYFKTTQDIYHPGDTIYAYFKFCKKRPLPAVVQWSLVDTILRIYPAKDSDLAVQCYDNAIYPIEKLTDTIPPHSYHFSGTYLYQLNPLKKYVVPLISNEFQVK